MTRTRLAQAVAIALILGLSGLGAPGVLAQDGPDWQPNLLSAESGTRKPTESIRIALPSVVREQDLQWLALELDGFDVSQIVQLEITAEGRVIVIKPPEPLAAGKHELRLVQYSQEGDIFERGAWTLEVKQSKFFQEAAVAAQVALNISHRADEGDLPGAENIKQTTGDGSAVIEARIAGKNWVGTGQANFLYNSQGVQVEGQDDLSEANKLEIGEYLFRLSDRQERLSALLGHHALNQQSLLIQDFYRRGTSFTGTTAGGMFSGSGFAFRTEPLTGFRNGLGFSNPKHRVAGAITTVRPIKGKPQALAVTATYLDAEGQDSVGVGVVGDQARSTGDGWSLAAESRLVDDRVKLRAEFAQTKFDFDADGGIFDANADDAFAILAQFSPWKADKQIKGQAAQWQIGGSYQEIGLFFRSLANPSLPSDLNALNLFSNFQWGGLGFNVNAGQQDTNVDDDPLLPVLRTNQVGVALNYTPQPAAPDPKQPDAKPAGWRRWLGQPTYTLAWESKNDEHRSYPVALPGVPVDGRIRNTQLGAMFQYTRWNWSVAHSTGWNYDDTNQQPDQQNKLTDLGLNFQIGDRVSIGSQFQYNTVFSDGPDLTNRTGLANINAQAVLIPQKLSATLNFSLNHQGASDDSIDTDTRTLGLNVKWNVKQAAGNVPGLSLWVQGERQDIEDNLNPANDTSPYQVFVGATINWSTQYPRGN